MLRIETLVKFVMVGGAATILQYVLFLSGVHLGLRPIEAVSASAYAISAVANYVLSRTFTFRTDALIVASGLRYLVMVLSGLALNTILMFSMIQGLDMHYLLSQVVATALIFFWNFALSSLWIFPAKPAPPD